jgi:hypothetical protein
MRKKERFLKSDRSINLVKQLFKKPQIKKEDHGRNPKIITGTKK